MTLIDKTLAGYSDTKTIGLKKILLCTHAKYSAIELCRVIQSAGIEVIFYPVDYSRESDNIDTLIAMGVRVVEQEGLLLPHIKDADCIIEDGARISKIIHKHTPALKQDFFAVEQTSGGIRYLEENPPLYPVINVAMSPVKLDVENRRATPEGVIQYFSEATGKTLGGKQVLVIGFGSIGEGLARFARILGANVTVYDHSAVRRVFAKHRGYTVIEEDEFSHALSSQDVVFMATNVYQGSSLGVEQLLLMKDGAIICNAGSGRGEVDLELQTPGQYTKHDASISIQEEDHHLKVQLSKGDRTKTITILAKAFPINLHLGRGTSHDAIEVVMSLMLLAALNGPDEVTAGIQSLNHDVQEQVALLSLQRSNQKNELTPRYVKTREIDVSERPYGGVFAFHNDLSMQANLSVVRAWFKAGTKTRGHYHRRSQEAYYAEQGTADVIVWRKGSSKKTTHHLSPGDYLLVPENYFHDVYVTSETDFECLVIATPPFQLWDQFFDEHSLVEDTSTTP